MTTPFPSRNQKAPQYWDTQLKDYIDEQSTPEAIESKLPARLSESGLSATYAADKGEGLMAALDQKRSPRLAIVGDSTAWKNGSGDYVGTDGNEWPKQVGLALGAIYPMLAVSYRKLNSSASAYETAALIDTGISAGAGAADTFNRTAANLTGSTSTGGQVWQSTSSGKYSVDGAKALYVNGSTGVTAQRLPVPTAGRLTATGTLTFIHDGGTHSGAAHNFLSSYVDSGNFLWATLVTGASSAASTITFKKSTTAGGTVTLGTKTLADAGVSVSANPQSVVWSITHVGDDVTFTVGAASATYTLTSGDSAIFAGGTQGGFWATGSAAANDHSWDDFSIVLNIPAAHTLTIDNGARGSQDADWSLANLALIMPTAPDAVIITHSHNHTTQTPAEFEADLDALVDGIRTTHGDSVAIIIGGQNPQYAPTANPAQHNARQADLRRYARARGFGYIPIFEAFMAQTDPAALVRADGVHPEAAGIDLIGDTAEAYLTGLSLKP